MSNNKEGFSDKLKGAVNKGKGEIKDQVGNATNDSKKQSEGKLDKAKGDVQDAFGDAKKDKDRK